jgi:hypothetical protein
MIETEKKFYLFKIADSSHVGQTFGCISTSLDAATLQASIAGCNDVQLLEVGEVRNPEPLLGFNKVDNGFEDIFDDDFEEDLNDGDDVYFSTVFRETAGWMFDDDEPVLGEEPIYYGGQMTFRDADVIFERLQNARLIDVRGRPLVDFNHKYDDENNVCLLGQGKKYGSSIYSGDDVDVYFIDVEVWTKREIEAYGPSAAFKKALLVEDPRVLALIGGDNWAIWVSRGARDGEISPKLLLEITSALGQGAILWQKPFPMPERPDRRFKDARHLTLNLNVDGNKDPLQINDFYVDEVHRRLDEQNASIFMHNHVDSGEYSSSAALVTWRPTGRIADLLVEVFVADYFGESLMMRLESHIPASSNHIYVTGDGWAIRISLGTHAHDYDDYALSVAAAVISSCLGGTIHKLGRP